MKNILTFLLFTSLSLTGETDLRLRSNSSLVDGIELVVTARTEDDNRKLINCTLTNRTKFILATALPRTPNRAYKFSLKDKLGNTIPMEKTWALEHSQPDGTNDYDLSRLTCTEIYIRPDQTEEFSFYLEDAYGERAKEGNTLEIRWSNSSPLQKGYNILRMDEIKLGDRIITPAYEEENHFPGRRYFTVELALTDVAAASGNTPPSTAPAHSVTEPATMQASRAQVQDSVQLPSPKSFDLRWLLLLLFPGLFLLFRFLRSRKTNVFTRRT